MKRSFTKTLALLIALTLALPTFALAEAGSAPEDVYIVGAAGDGEVFPRGSSRRHCRAGTTCRAGTKRSPPT